MHFDKFCDLIHSRLQITTSDGNFEGVLKFILVAEQRVTFEHVFVLPSRDYLGTMHILFSSISSWRLLERTEINFNISNFDSSSELFDGEFSKSKRIDRAELIEVTQENDFLKCLPAHLTNNCPGDYCIIDTVDVVFAKAFKQLSESNTLGASFHGPKISRDGILTWISISTPSCVFLFDIGKLGESAFNGGLREIFENEEIEKVIHDCRKVADCLLRLFNVKLKSVFDTQIADYLINMQMCTGNTFKYVNSLDSCLFKYLNVPQQFLYNRNKSVLFEDEVQFYEKRPIGHEFINVLMKSSMYLLLLKEKQEILLLSPFEQAVELYLNCIRSSTDFEVNMIQTEFSQSAPICLSKSLNSVHFFNLPCP